jgi:hypothetical protein
MQYSLSIPHTMANRVVRMSDDWHNFDEDRFGPREDYAKMVHEGAGLQSAVFIVASS